MTQRLGLRKRRLSLFWVIALINASIWGCGDSNPSGAGEAAAASEFAGTTTSGFAGGGAGETAGGGAGETAGGGAGETAGGGAGETAGGGAGEAAGVSAGVEMTPVVTTRSMYERLKPACEACHAAGLSFPIFATLGDFESLIVRDATWVTPGNPDASPFLSLLRGEARGAYAQMPPGPTSYAVGNAGVDDAPTMEELEAWIAGLSGEEPIEETPCAVTPTRGALARLSRDEYRNAVRDLLGTTLDPGADFPSENESYGFSHIAALLTLSPLLLEKYDLAAAALATEAIPSTSGSSEIYILEAENDMTSDVGRVSGEVWNMWSQGTLEGWVTLPTAGEYTISVSAGGGQAGPDPVRFALLINEVEVGVFESTAQSPARDVRTLTLELTAGEQLIGVRFLNDYYCPQDRFDAGQCSGLGDRNLLIDRVRVEGPLSIETARSTFEERFITCDPATVGRETCTRSILTRFGRLAWRRPLDSDELDRLWTLASTEAEWRDGMRLAVHALLLSPYFVFRVERAPEGERLNAYERAARLAAFIWRSVPDEALLNAAERGELDTPEGAASEIARLLTDTRAQALVEEFGGRWMQLHHLDAVEPDYALFPDFSEGLRASMREESRRVLNTIVSEERSLLDLVDADFTWINRDLATLYGFDFPDATRSWQRVELPQAGRLGFLTQAAWLTLTSHPTRTSPVARGKWVLENLLCSPPPPPPPGVEGLVETDVDQDASLRERFEQHRADPACAACHTHMDAIGFGLEQFNAVGRFRVMDGREVINPSGELPTTPPVRFSDAVEMMGLLRADPALPRCVTERMIIFALGRGLGEEERCMVDEVMSNAGQLSLQSLASAIAQSVMMNTQGERR